LEELKRDIVFPEKSDDALKIIDHIIEQIFINTKKK